MSCDSVAFRPHARTAFHASLEAHWECLVFSRSPLQASCVFERTADTDESRGDRSAQGPESLSRTPAQGAPSAPADSRDCYGVRSKAL